jgi:acetyl esterase/lipase
MESAAISSEVIGDRHEPYGATAGPGTIGGFKIELNFEGIFGPASFCALSRGEIEFKMLTKTISLLLSSLVVTTDAFAISAQEPAATQKETGTFQQAGAEGVAVEADVPYASVNGSVLRLDIYQPADRGAAIRPGALLIHGGGWTSLDKSTMRSMGQFLALHGFVAFSVDYRLLQGAENRWPAQLDDVQRAVRWIRANATRYGVNPDRIGAFGHSAGAQLAALLGMEDTRDNSDSRLANYSSRVQAVVDVSGPSDFTADNTRENGPFLKNLLGADYAQHPEIWREASPAFRVSADTAPFLIVHGTQDQSVPISQAEELFKKLQAAGKQVSFIKVNDAHTFVTPEARRQLAIETIIFFKRYLLRP